MEFAPSLESKLVDIFIPVFQDQSVIRYSFEIVFTQSGSSSSRGTLFTSTLEIPQAPTREATRLISQFYHTTKDDFRHRFNKAVFSVDRDNTCNISFIWDEDEIKKQKGEWAYVLPQWINDRLISVLFSAGYGTEKEWQLGVFTFTIINNSLNFEGVLYNQGIPKTAKIELPDYVKEGIIEHYLITNKGLLKDQWQPWTKMIIRSPHNDLNLEKDVSYLL